MNPKRFCFIKYTAILVSLALFLLGTLPAYGYYMGKWSTDGYIASQFGIFTEKHPFNKAKFGGSDDNISTARQSFRWNVNGPLSKKLAVRAEVLAVWEPEYAGEKGVIITEGILPANYYNSFDWRELTIEYKPTYTHSIKFGRQIINWGEAVSGRVIDQCNPTDSRASAGFLSLEDIYMPLWMFRGQHDFYNWETSLEWVVAPIWQADRFEHTRGITGDTPVGDGRTTAAQSYVSASPLLPSHDAKTESAFLNNPSSRFSAKRDNRIEKVWGADVSLNSLGLPGSVLGAPYSTGYHASDILYPTSPMRPLTRGEAAAIVSAPGFPTAFVNSHPADTKFVFLSESPSFEPGIYDYTDHNIKNSRWGFKTKSMVGDGEFGFSFFQGPAHTPVLKVSRYVPASSIYALHTGTIVYQYIYPRYNTYGLYGNYELAGTKFLIEAAYQPDRRYSKDLMGIGYGSIATGTGPTDTGTDAAIYGQRLHSLKEIDRVVTLLGASREVNIPFLNRRTPFSLNFQYTNTYHIQSEIEDCVTIASFFSRQERMTHSFLLSARTSYSYNKYLPSLTVLYYPEGAVYAGLGMTYIPDGFNSRLSCSFAVGNYWTANEFSAPISVYDNHDSVTVGFKYKFY